MDNNIEEKLKKFDLNNTQVKAYLHILENGCCELKTLAKKFRLTKAAISKLLISMEEKGFIQSFDTKSSKAFFLQDLFLLRKEYILNKREKLKKFKHIIDELNFLHDSNNIKTRRFGVQYRGDYYKHLIEKNTEVFLFVDLRKKLPQENPPKKWRKVDFSALYYHKDITLSIGKKINIDHKRFYADYFSVENKTILTPRGTNPIEIRNQEIANTIQLLIKIIYEGKNLGEWEFK